MLLESPPAGGDEIETLVGGAVIPWIVRHSVDLAAINLDSTVAMSSVLLTTSTAGDMVTIVTPLFILCGETLLGMYGDTLLCGGTPTLAPPAASPPGAPAVPAIN
jgi:hypothetical protein